METLGDVGEVTKLAGFEFTNYGKNTMIQGDYCFKRPKCER